ncbi:MAG: zinc ABC transporter substrate-binding protein, partial [Acidimicrobiia bacterium]|nr:zinc ABC transporter substrate-binding protein [Acidimicrobiia bacterium]MDX2467764.1 zinc ABC transporter substrate-binding protein [Acidimicrobiia bacterium]
MRRPAIAIVTIALLAAACGGSDNDDAGDSLTVVATTTILGDVVQNVVGDNATVEVLLPIG